MQYVLYILLVAVIFGLVALGDFLLGKLFPKPQTMKSGNVLRMPRYSMIFGTFMTLLSIIGLLFLPLQGEWFLTLGIVVVLIMGLFLLFNYSRFAIFYDEEQFIYRTLTKKAKTYRYSDIESQRSFLAKSGFNTTLYAAGDEIALNGSMQGLPEFLSKAFYRWCEQTDIDPNTVENDPSVLQFFPQPREETD